MKKLLLSGCLATMSFLTVKGQDVPNVHKTILAKFTAAWCGPCGNWGWEE